MRFVIINEKLCLEVRSVAADEASTVATDRLDGTANDGTVGASGASSNGLGNSGSTEADTELGRAEADKSAIGGTLASTTTGSGSRGSRRWGSRSRRGRRGRSTVSRSGCRGSWGSRSTTGGSTTLSTAASGESVTADSALDLDRLARVGEVDVLLGSSGTAVANVSLEDIGASVEGGSVRCSTSDGDGSALHVHLTVTSLVKPDPSKGQLTVGGVLGDRDLDLVRNWPAGGGGDFKECVSVGGNAVRHVHWAAANDTVDDLPLGAWSWLGVGAEGELA